MRNHLVVLAVLACMLFAFIPEAQARVFFPELGRWSTRDRMGYVDGPNLSQYVRGRPIADLDPGGTFGVIGRGQCCNNTSQPLLIHPGPRILNPGECSGSGDTCDFWYIPGQGWVKCPGTVWPGQTQCSPTDSNPTDGHPARHPNDPNRMPYDGWSPSKRPGVADHCTILCFVREVFPLDFVLAGQKDTPNKPPCKSEDKLASWCSCMAMCTGTVASGCPESSLPPAPSLIPWPPKPRFNLPNTRPDTWIPYNPLGN